MRWILNGNGNINKDHFRYIIRISRQLIKDITDYFRMQLNYGLVGEAIANLKKKRNSIWMKLSGSQKASLLTYPDSKEALSVNGPNFGLEYYSEELNHHRNKYPKITIVTCIFNHVKVIEKCIQSILQQRYPNLEYIIIDRGSNDNSLSIIKDFSSNLSHWESIPAVCEAEAINKGLNYTTGDIFNWLNPKDYLEPHSLFRCAEAFRKNQLASGWVGATRKIDSNGNVNKIIFPNGMEKENLLLNWNGGQLSQPSCFLSTTKLKECGKINSDFSTLYGLDLWLRLLDRGYFIAAKGIWSSSVASIFHGFDNSGSAYIELSRLKAKYGFSPLTNGGKRQKDKKRQFGYTIPPNLRAKWKKSNDLNKRATEIFDTPPRLTFFCYNVPRFDKTSAEFRLYNILHLLLSNKCKIDYIYCSKSLDDNRYMSTFKENINFIHKPLNIEDCTKAVKNNIPDRIWISELWRIEYMEFIVELSQTLKSQFPQVKIILDTVDFHFKEFYRKYEQSGNQTDLDVANIYLKNEKMIYQTADVVVVVSEDEKRDIQNEIKNIQQLAVIPNIHEIQNKIRSFSKRRDICFLGNFGTKHNFDAVQFFLDDIFHIIHKINPTVEFHVIGNLSEKYRKAFCRPNVKVIGSLKYLHKALTHYKLFVCPLTYGTGMKGKIGDAVTAGIPVVTSSFGAEGFPVTDGTECFIDDSPMEFAHKCNQVLNDPILWHNFSYKSRLMMAENFSPGVVAEKLEKLLL